MFSERRSSVSAVLHEQNSLQDIFQCFSPASSDGRDVAEVGTAIVLLTPTQPDSHGAAVVVFEDNKINMRVIERTLKEGFAEEDIHLDRCEWAKGATDEVLTQLTAWEFIRRKLLENKEIILIVDRNIGSNACYGEHIIHAFFEQFPELEQKKIIPNSEGNQEELKAAIAQYDAAHSVTLFPEQADGFRKVYAAQLAVEYQQEHYPALSNASVP